MNSTLYTGTATGFTARMHRFWLLLRSYLPTRPVEPNDKAYLFERLLHLVVFSRAVIALAGLGFVVAMAIYADTDIPVFLLAAIMAVVGAVSWAGLARTRSESPVTEGDLMLQVTCDVVILTIVLSLYAGHKSPFDHLYVLPVLLGSHAFSGWRMAAVAIAITIGWTTVSQFALPGPIYPDTIWITGHLASGALLAYLAISVAGLSRKHEQILSARREREIAALGAEASSMVAARAAHALSTPLGTMAVLVSDLRGGHIAPAEQESALEMLATQIAHSKAQLTGLLASTGVERGEGGYRADVVQVLTEIREECLLYFPQGRVSLAWPDDSPAPPEIVIEMSLFNALAGLVKDFVREPPHVARVSAAWDAEEVVIRVGGLRTDGAAVRGRRAERLAVLAAIVDRHAGRVVLEPGGGRRINVRLPHADHHPTSSNNHNNT